jgi:hypothetical protein
MPGAGRAGWLRRASGKPSDGPPPLLPGENIGECPRGIALPESAGTPRSGAGSMSEELEPPGRNTLPRVGAALQPVARLSRARQAAQRVLTEGKGNGKRTKSVFAHIIKRTSSELTQERIEIRGTGAHPCDARMQLRHVVARRPCGVSRLSGFIPATQITADSLVESQAVS